MKKNTNKFVNVTMIGDYENCAELENVQVVAIERVQHQLSTLPDASQLSSDRIVASIIAYRPYRFDSISKQ